jgi:hypothetical protein
VWQTKKLSALMGIEMVHCRPAVCFYCYLLQEAKTLLAILYQHFTFEYAGSQPEEQGYKVTSYPMYRVPVKIHLRHKNDNSKKANTAMPNGSAAATA